MPRSVAPHGLSARRGRSRTAAAGEAEDELAGRSTILQNSADRRTGSATRPGFLDNVHRQGAGMVDIDDAILATTKIEPARSRGEARRALRPGPQDREQRLVAVTTTFVRERLVHGRRDHAELLRGDASVASACPAYVPAGARRT